MCENLHDCTVVVEGRIYEDGETDVYSTPEKRSHIYFSFPNVVKATAPTGSAGSFIRAAKTGTDWSICESCSLSWNIFKHQSNILIGSEASLRAVLSLAVISQRLMTENCRLMAVRVELETVYRCLLSHILKCQGVF